jgi:hypothetical protein
MSISAQYQKSLDDAARGALRSLVTNNPTTSVADLRELVADHPSLGGVTLTELLGRDGSKPAPARRGRPPKRAATETAATTTAQPKKVAAPAPKRVGGHDEWETRTEDVRAALDRAVLETLSAFGGVGVSAEAIRARLGATPAQIRTSLNRHIEAGDVSFSGKARGTRYTLEA